MRSPQVVVLTAVGLCALGIPPGARGDFWERKPPLLTPRRLLAAAVYEGKIYTFGGCGSPCFQPPLHTSTFEETRVEVFDPKVPPPDGAWSVKRPIPAILFGAAAATSGKKIYLFGGFVTGNATYEYDPEGDTWKREAPMPTPRHGLAAVAVDGKIYVLGGSNGSAPSRALEIYDPAKNTWERGPSMPTARVFLAAAVVGKEIYAIGGSPDCCGEGRTDAVEVYHVDRKSWRAAAPLRVALQVSAAATAANGKIYVFGGFIPGSGVQDTTFEYDSATDDWDTKTRLLPPRSGGEPGRDQAAAVALEDGIHLLGGSTDCHCRALDDHDRYVPDGVPPLKADLQVIKDNKLEQLFPRQENVVYTIVVRNNGPDPVEGATVTDGLPTLFNGATWSCAPSAGATRTAPCPGLGQSLNDRVNLPVGGRVTYTLAGTVAANARGRVTNCAEVKAPEGVMERDLGNNVDCDSDPVVRCLVPTITKTDGRHEVEPGEKPIYEITVGNPYPAPLLVTVEDDLLASGLTAVSWCQGAACTPSTEGNLKDEEDLPAGGTVVYRATGSVPDTPPCVCTPPPPIKNTATATPVRELDPKCKASVTDEDPIRPSPPGDLAVTITTPPDVEGCALERMITVRNSGPGIACNVVLRGEASGDFVLESLPALCAEGPPCNLGPEAPPVMITASLAPAPGAKCPAVGDLTVSVESVCVPHVETESAKDDIQVPCDLCIVKSVDMSAAAPGDPLFYTIEVTNPGCVSVHDADVSDTFPPSSRT